MTLLATKQVLKLLLAAASLSLLSCSSPEQPTSDQSLLDPLQISVAAAPFDFQSYRLTPVAQFALTARVLSKRVYRLDSGAKLAPVDLALGWGVMAEPKHYQQVKVTQSGRWYRWRLDNQSTLTQSQVSRHSANMHLIPATKHIKKVLTSAKAHDQIFIKGFLVNTTGPNGFYWNSSTTRLDTGAGACELIYVEAAFIL